MPSFTRRGFLTAALGGLAMPSWFPRVAFAASPDEAATRDVLVCVFLRGGADGMNLIVPHGDPDYHRSRPTLALPEPGGGPDAAVDLDGFFGLHPALAPLGELWSDGALAAVHAVGSPNETRSHFDAMDFLERGTPGDKSVTTGWIGRHLATSAGLAPPSPFRAVGIGRSIPTSLRGPVPAVALKSIADFHLEGGEEIAGFRDTLASLYAGHTGTAAHLDGQGSQALEAVELLAREVPGDYTPRPGVAYPDGELGLALGEVARLVKAQVGLEVACIDLGGWDTHEGQGAAEGRMAALLAEVGSGLHAFHADTSDEPCGITVLVMSEFGRRLAENAAGGTDHGRAGTMLLAGRGVAGGRVYGDWPGLAPEQLEDRRDLRVTTDFRRVLSEVTAKRLGNPATAEIFPGWQPEPHLGLLRSL